MDVEAIVAALLEMRPIKALNALHSVCSIKRYAGYFVAFAEGL